MAPCVTPILSPTLPSFEATQKSSSFRASSTNIAARSTHTVCAIVTIMSCRTRPTTATDGVPMRWVCWWRRRMRPRARRRCSLSCWRSLPRWITAPAACANVLSTEASSSEKEVGMDLATSEGRRLFTSWSTATTWPERSVTGRLSIDRDSHLRMVSRDLSKYGHFVTSGTLNILPV